jgi:hypothetical protein
MPRRDHGRRRKAEAIADAALRMALRFHLWNVEAELLTLRVEAALLNKRVGSYGAGFVELSVPSQQKVSKHFVQAAGTGVLVR